MGQIVFGEIASKILIVIGMLFVVLALIAAVREEFTRKAVKAAQVGTGEEGLLQDATAFVGQLKEAPRWMSMVIVGILIIVCGSALEANFLMNLFGGGAEGSAVTTEG